MFRRAIPPTRLASPLPSAFPSPDPSFHMFFALTMSKIFLLTIAVVSYLAMVAAAPITSDSGSDLVKRVTHEGRGTWFWPGMGNCGWNNGENDKIVAISKSRYDAEHASNCGQWMEITNLANGRTVLAQTVDSCPGCGYDDLDMSPGAFKALADLSEGQLKVKWHFESKSFHP